MKRRFRILAAFLSVVMLFSAMPVMPMSAAAAEADNPQYYPNAMTAADAYLANVTYENNGKGYFENCGGYNFWQCVESLEVVLDAYEQTGAAKYLDAAEKLYAGFIEGNKTGARGTDWSPNDYNDDIMWGVIASARLYLMTNNSYYLDVGKSNFDMCYARAWDTSFMGGGLWWRTENESKNACVEGPGAIAACLLGDATGDTVYYDKAKAIIDWTIKNLYQSDGTLWDSVYTNKNPNTWCSTYNQGTFIGACTMLSKHFSDVDYLSYAKKAAERATSLNLNGEQNSGDLIGFKGILGRWLGYYCRETGDKTMISFMQGWAQTIWDNRNSDNLMWTKFNSKTPNDLKNQNIDGIDVRSWAYWGCSAAVSWIVNTPGTVDGVNGLENIEAVEAVKISVDETAEITVKVYPEDSWGNGLVWKVADETVVKLDGQTANGAVIRGLKEGTTVVTVASVLNPEVKAEIAVTVTPSPYDYVTIEAEDGANNTGEIRTANPTTHSGGAFVGGWDNGKSATFTFTSAAAGDVVMRIYGCSAQNRGLVVTINGVTLDIETANTGSWDATNGALLGTVTIPVIAGENTMVVGGRATEAAPNVDYFRLALPKAVEKATLTGEDVTVKAGEEIKVPVTLNDVKGIAGIKGVDGTIAAIQFTVSGAELAGFEPADAFKAYDWDAKNGRVIGFNMVGDDIKIADLDEDVQIGTLTFKPIETEGETEVILTIEVICDDLGASYNNGVSALPFVITVVKPEPEIKVIASGWSGYTTWVLTDDGVLTFSPTDQLLGGQCNLRNYWKIDGVLTLPWGDYADLITSVVIEDGIHDIGQMAFYELPNLKTVTLGADVVEIRNYAFKNCTALTTINLENVDYIREGAFYGCTALEDITLAEDVVIEDWAFSHSSVTLN